MAAVFYCLPLGLKQNSQSECRSEYFIQVAAVFYCLPLRLKQNSQSERRSEYFTIQVAAASRAKA